MFQLVLPLQASVPSPAITSFPGVPVIVGAALSDAGVVRYGPAGGMMQPAWLSSTSLSHAGWT